MNWILVFIGGGLGSVVRYAISLGVKKMQWATHFPWATVITNVVSCFVFALILNWILQQKEADAHSMRLLLLTGFCGGFSTFSTFSFENFELFKSEQYILLLLNVLISVALGFMAFLAVAKNA